MKNHIQVKELSVQWHKSPCFYKKDMPKRSFKQDYFLKKNNNSKKNQKRLVKKHIIYSKIYTTLLNSTLKKIFTTTDNK
jgi:hypothetical protein